MPIENYDYRPSFLLRNGHANTIYASLCRKVRPAIAAKSVRLATPDDDFIDLDHYKQGSSKVLIVSHGLEGHSRRPYVLGMVREALARGWDVIAWNFRGCSGEPNRKITNYHSGSTEDLAHVCDYADRVDYDSIALCGFSIGGNKTLLLGSRDKKSLNPKVIAAIAYSVPCDLVSSSMHLALPRNRVYMRNFLTTLRAKLEAKQKMYPGQIDLTGFDDIKTFEDFDGRYTAPMNGFDSAIDYWTQSSSLPHLQELELPTALITSRDDPFLTEACYPIEAAETNRNFHLFLTEKGGHVGFARGLLTTSLQPLISETLGLDFLERQLGLDSARLEASS
jgi:predicted alpha/beta-fold hydrolase